MNGDDRFNVDGKTLYFLIILNCKMRWPHHILQIDSEFEFSIKRVQVFLKKMLL